MRRLGILDVDMLGLVALWGCGGIAASLATLMMRNMDVGSCHGLEDGGCGLW